MQEEQTIKHRYKAKRHKWLSKQNQKGEEEPTETTQVNPFAYLTLEPRETRWRQCRSPRNANQNATGRDQQEEIWNRNTDVTQSGGGLQVAQRPTNRPDRKYSKKKDKRSPRHVVAIPAWRRATRRDFDEI